jgi:hypothetical protein
MQRVNGMRALGRGAEKQKEFNEAVEKKLREEEEATHYKANPIRHSFGSSNRSSRSYEPAPLTETQPFNLRSEMRHEMSRAQVSHVRESDQMD